MKTKKDDTTPDKAAMMKDIAVRFKNDLELFDTVQVTLIKDENGVGQARMNHKDILFLQEAFSQTLPDVLANLLMAVKEQLKEA